MSKVTIDQSTNQFDSLFVAPLRAYGALNVEYVEQLTASQLEMAGTVSSATLAQARGWLAVQDPQGVHQVLEGQRRVVEHLGECLKDSAEALVTLSRDYVQKGQQLAEQQLKAASLR